MTISQSTFNPKRPTKDERYAKKCKKNTGITQIHVTFIPYDPQIGMYKYEETETTFRILSHVHPNMFRGNECLKRFIGVS